MLLLFLLYAGAVSAQPPKGSVTMENYYKVKWGHAEEFIKLWKTNHYPLLRKAIEAGDIISVTAQQPNMHGTEDGRWDFRVVIVFKNSVTALDPDLTEPYKKLLYPDAAKLEKDEQYRFSLILAHWDILVDHIALNP